MKLFTEFSLLALSATSTLAYTIPVDAGSIVRRDRQPDYQTIAAWETTGSCFSYFELLDPERSARPCRKEDLDQSIDWQDDDGNDFTPGVCICDGIGEVAEVISDIVIEALQQMDEVFCAVCLSAFDTIIQTGILAIPGAAKTFLENGGEAADFFGGWVGKTCNLPDWNFDLLGMVFGVLKDAPDSTATSVGTVDAPSPTSNPSEADKTSATGASTSTSASSTTEDACAARSTNGANNRGSTRRAIDLGILDLLQPPSGQAVELIAQFCNSAWTRPGQPAKRGAGNGELEPRVIILARDGEVAPKGMKYTQIGQEAVWSQSFGTCPGVVLVGKPRNSNNYRGYLMHMSLGGEEDGFLKVRKAFNGLINAVEADGMTDLRGWLYTVDTRPTSPEVLEYPELMNYVEPLEVMYASIWAALQRLVGCGGHIPRSKDPTPCSSHPATREYSDLASPCTSMPLAPPPHLRIVNTSYYYAEDVSFPKFPKLPPDLRIAIWQAYLKEHRLLEVQVDPWAPDNQPTERRRPRRLSQANRHRQGRGPRHLSPDNPRSHWRPSRDDQPVQPPVVTRPWSTTNHLGKVVSGQGYDAIVLGLRIHSKLLRVSRESRRAALSFYRVHLPCSFQRYADEYQDKVKGMLYFNPDHDLRAHDPRHVGLVNVGLRSSRVETFSRHARDITDPHVKAAFVSFLSGIREIIWVTYSSFGRTMMPYQGFDNEKIGRDPRPVGPELRYVLTRAPDPRSGRVGWSMLLDMWQAHPAQPARQRALYAFREAASHDPPIEGPEELSKAVRPAIGFWLFPVEAAGDIRGYHMGTKTEYDLSAYWPELALSCLT
ncbi:unnamed protein product [Parascedosporium putredinis]|uniref:2EXR domain-containing protein n=1 Tax=Parascedosporium putredinis TaxID=1442378 RepID=A0A9P1H3I0_9PEZI|nr:unnamed protein product [Parascedosporium putredinis]CAI7997049.1 unnamed protein product [Parascedosporium putredinis]